MTPALMAAATVIIRLSSALFIILVPKAPSQLSQARLSHETAIEINRLGPDRLGGKALDGELARRRSITGAQLLRRGQGLNRMGQGPFVIDWHEHAGLAGVHHFAASGNIGGDHGPAASRGLEQAFRQALAP